MHNEWQAQRQAEAAAFEKTARAVVEKLGAEWSAKWPHEEPGTFIHAVRNDGLVISISTHKKRLHSSPCPPLRNGGMASLSNWGVIPYNDSAPSASCAVDRPPETIAREFMRKVVEPYAPMYAAILERQRLDANEHATAESSYRALCAAFSRPVDARQLENLARGNTAEISIYNGDSWYGNAVVSSHSVEFKLRSLGHDLAAKLAAELVKLAPKPAG